MGCVSENTIQFLKVCIIIRKAKNERVIFNSSYCKDNSELAEHKDMTRDIK